MMASRAITAVLAFAGVSLIGCDSGTSTTAGIDRGGIIMPVAVDGPITGFGSIIVNDVRYDIDQATVTVNGSTTNQSGLALGQIVHVEGEIEDGATDATANAVVFDAHLRGPVESVDATQQVIRVLGQAVTIDVSTIFDLAPDADMFSSIMVNDVVEISGYTGANGVVVATRIETETALDLQVRGVVGNLSAAVSTFAINQLILDYSSASVVEGFPSGGPRNGDEVVAIGLERGASGQLLVQQLRFVDSISVENEGDEAEVEGLITRFVSELDFDVSNQRATTTGQTVFEGGDINSLAVNVKVEIEGTVNAEGVIVASKVEVKDGGRVFN